MESEEIYQSNSFMRRDKIDGELRSTESNWRLEDEKERDGDI